MSIIDHERSWGTAFIFPFSSAHFLVILVVVCALLLAVTPQAAAQTSDTVALVLVQQATSALGAGSGVSDLVLSGSATRKDASGTVSGAIVLKATAQHQSRTDFNVTTGVLTQVRDSSTRIPSGHFVDSSGVVHALALHNCWTDVGWFSPVISELLTTSDSTLVFRYSGQETMRGVAVNHIVVKRRLTDEPPQAAVFVAQLSTTDFYLDAKTSLPVAMRFNQHPDSSASTNLLVTVNFSQYQQLSTGQMVPFRITRYESSVVTDIQLTNVVVNSGVTASVFAN
jgi:hypothetical protein